jgi:hypothetical protein
MPDLVDGLTFAALVAGALEYAILIRHREVGRANLRMDLSIEEAGLRALVRVVLIDEQTPQPRRRFPRLRRPILRSVARTIEEPAARRT